MNNIERRDNGILYISDESVFEQQKRARRLTQKLNTMDRSDFEGISAVVKELLGKSEGAFINPPFYCDYGFNIEVGKTTVRSPRASPSIRQAIRSTPLPATQPTSTESTSRSAITSGSAEIPSSCPASISAITS